MIIPAPAPAPSPWSLPKLKLHIEDLGHEGASIFLGAVNPKDALKLAVEASYRWLYTQENPPPKVTQILLVLRSMPGVAHTTGTETEKEIHFSLEYIVQCKNRATAEILGVLVHEVVHCYQYSAKGSCPGGLIEGIADYVRLKANYGPPHWKRRGEGAQWDAGYETTGYFLSWIEDTYGPGLVSNLNLCMKDTKYHHRVFKNLTQCSVKKLWKAYCALLKDDDGAKVLEILNSRDEEDDQ
ncbi:hypothetical protein EST38_g3196 [Candolleomyces aberdarensis]|uniref:Plant basic secretory protein n=1 Tax=Candolleomyces aberdarensis TaxID=2316362 RepID=A0A4Q2DU93_9AGAR|nr:hypothetical protein EST38_g3196 [Candolleomyces aberdarensis]